MLTTVDLQLRSAKNISIQAAQLWFEKLLGFSPCAASAKPMFDGAHKSAVLSPDGTRLYVIGHVYSSRSHNPPASLGLQMIDLASGQRVASRPLPATWVNWLKITPSGERLVVGIGDSYSGRRSTQSSTEFMLFDPQSVQVTGVWIADGTKAWWS